MSVDRVAIVMALEALEDGDQNHAVNLLECAREAGPTLLRFPCRVCGQRFEWPGPRDAHEQLAHNLEDVA
jgi:hypothetical protein